MQKSPGEGGEEKINKWKKASASCSSCSNALPRATAHLSAPADAEVDLEYSWYKNESLHSTSGFLVITPGFQPACNGFNDLIFVQYVKTTPGVSLFSDLSQKE